MSRQPRHRWIPEQLAGPGLAGQPAPWLPPVSAHRRLRGPYTAAGTIVRMLVPGAVASVPDLLSEHGIELLSVAPELTGQIELAQALHSATSPDQELTRFFSRLRTVRLAHGLTEFIRDCASATCSTPVSLTITHTDQADPTDQEFMAVLLRRLDPGLVTIVLCGTAGLPAGLLAHSLARYAEAGEPAAAGPVAAPPAGNGQVHAAGACAAACPAARAVELAGRYVAGDCLSTDPAARAAYLRIPDALRRELHDRRAAELAHAGEPSAGLGAIPYHRERGSDPAAAVAALRSALHHCLGLGFYLAAVDLAERGRALVSWSADPDTRYWFTTMLATALIALARPDEAEVMYEEVRRNSTDPGVHMSVAYATGILLTRHRPEDRRDHHRARGWLNQAIAIADLLPDSPRLALQRVFNRVGAALTENHLGNGQAALRLVTEGLELLPPETDPGEYRLQRSVLHLRRVQTYVGLGQMEMAVSEYRKVLEADPDYPEYHLELGNLLRGLGREVEALAEYEAAIRLSPPFAEAYYNRAEVRAAFGDLEGAVADYRYVIELAPETIDAHVNLASSLDEMGDAAAALAAAQAGLAMVPDHAPLLCIRGQLELAAGRPGSAKAALDAAVASDPELAEAWATRGAAAFETGDLAQALADLSTAWELSQDIAILFNRGVVYQALGDWAEAIADFGRVLEYDPDEEESLLRMAECRAQASAEVHQNCPVMPSSA